MGLVICAVHFVEDAVEIAGVYLAPMLVVIRSVRGDGERSGKDTYV